jgi:hypothetical protein
VEGLPSARSRRRQHRCVSFMAAATHFSISLRVRFAPKDRLICGRASTGPQRDAGLLAGTTICASIYGRFQSDADLDALLGMSAAAQTGGVYVNAIDLVIVPSEMAKYIEAIKENAFAAVKEPGCREFNVKLRGSLPMGPAPSAGSMPTIVTHGFVAALLGKSLAVGQIPARFLDFVGAPILRERMPIAASADEELRVGDRLVLVQEAGGACPPQGCSTLYTESVKQQ